MKTTCMQYLMCMVMISGIGCLSASAADEPAAPRPKPAIELGMPFADNAILQRQMKVPVWGWSMPGTKITVEFAGQKKSATAGKDGKWMVRLDPLKGSSVPAEMIIRDNRGKSVTLKNILVGEVWMASGQSNMQTKAKDKNNVRELVGRISKRVEAGEEKQPLIRECKTLDVRASLYPLERVRAEWSDGSDFTEHGAYGFAFAYELYKELQVPIGILLCAQSATSIRAWTPREGIEAATDEYSRELYQKILEGDFRTPQHKAAWEQYYEALREHARAMAERHKKGVDIYRVPGVPIPGNLRGSRDIGWMYNTELHPVVPHAIRGAIQNHGAADIDKGYRYYNNLHNQIRGWRKVWNRPDLPYYFHQYHAGGGDGLSPGLRLEMRPGAWMADGRSVRTR